MNIYAKRLSLFFALSVISLFAVVFVPLAAAQTETPTPTQTSDTSQQANDLKNQINELQKKVNDLQGQERTLSSQISVMDSQIKLTELRISATEGDIAQLNGDIDIANDQIVKLQATLDEVVKVLLNRIVTTYQMGNLQPLSVLLNSNDLTDASSRLSYLKLVQLHDKQLIYEIQQAKEDYANQKQIFEDKKKKIEALKTQLEDYTKQLAVQKQSKQKLLAETQGSEANYSRLLSQARAQLAGFSRFTASQGGASLLSGQTICDDWGCYYNQRDSQWGGNSLNGTQYSLASDGCLVTSMAMVYTHYGHRGVTPQTINSNPNNFASYYPAWLSFTITADGASSSRVRDVIDSNLSAGTPVVVGVSYDGGPLADHFVVLISGSGGSYKMNDPFTPNGHNIPFTDHYSVGSIREVYKVNF